MNNYSNPNINNVIAELSGEVITEKTKIKKLSIFCEDDVARHILNNWLSTYKKYFVISKCSLGAEEYLELIRVKLPSIQEAVVVLDGDKNKQCINTKITRYSAHNVIFLPSSDCPEKMFYKFLYSLPEDDSFWDNSIGGFDKNKCFLEYATLLTENASTESYKNWYKSVKSYFGRNCLKLFNYWKITQKDEYESFIQSFITAYNSIAEICNAEKIS